jgi:hypothetical protein
VTTVKVRVLVVDVVVMPLIVVVDVLVRVLVVAVVVVTAEDPVDVPLAVSVHMPLTVVVRVGDDVAVEVWFEALQVDHGGRREVEEKQNQTNTSHRLAKP